MIKNIELKEISREIGVNIDLIQGAGGNTSVKEDGVLWIKASGCWLSDAIKHNIFVPVDNAKVLSSIKTGDVSNISIKKEQYLGDLSLRPSIETALHALMPHKFVLHVHAVNTLSIAVLSNGKKYTERLLKDINWTWVPYIMPGIELARAVQCAMREDPDVIVLANHGLVIGAETAKQALSLLTLVENKMKRKIRKTIEVDNERLLSVISKSKYRMPKYAIAHAIARDNVALRVIKTGALYPDHVVFLGVGPMKVLSIDEFENALKDPLYVNNNSVIIVRDFGVVVSSDFSDNAESMLYCLASVLLRIQEGEELCYLTQEDEMELMDWDAEKYRQSIQR
jgi:rhamnose utilization protein RhaD (predicted bifunctional aldolase and dehydrogenase)